MSRVRVYLGCSLDGCIAGPNHNLTFLHEQPAPEGAKGGGLGFEDFMSDIGALLMGRRTYQVPLDHDAWFFGDRPVLVATRHPLPPAPKGGNARAVEGPESPSSSRRRRRPRAARTSTSTAATSFARVSRPGSSTSCA